MVTLAHVLAVHFVADDKGAFTSAVGLIFDASPFLGGPRSKVDIPSSWDTSWLILICHIKRYVLVVDNGKVTSVHVEEHPPDVKETAADKILSVL